MVVTSRGPHLLKACVVTVAIIIITFFTAGCSTSMQDPDIAMRLDVACYAVDGFARTSMEVKQGLEKGSIDRDSGLRKLETLIDGAITNFLLPTLDIHGDRIESDNLKNALGNMVDAKYGIWSLAGFIELTLLDQPCEYLDLPGISWNRDDNGILHFIKEGTELSAEEVYNYLILYIDQHLDEAREDLTKFWQEDHNP